MFAQQGAPPMRYVAGNVVYGRGGLDDGWACFVLSPSRSDFDLLAERMSTQQQLAEFVRKIERDGSLVRMAREWDAEHYLAGRAERESSMPELRDAWVEGQREALAEGCVTAAMPRVFLAVRLAAEHRDLRDRLVRGIPARRAIDWFGTAGRMVRDGLLPDRVRERDQRVAQSFLSMLAAYPSLAARPATTADIQWWVRRVYSRGLADPRVDPDDVPQGVMVVRGEEGAVRPLEVDLLRWTGGVESGPRRPDHVVSTSPEGGIAVQQTMMSTSWHPTADRAERALGLALVAPRGLDWPIDLAVSWEWHSNAASRRAMDRQARETLEDARQEESSQLGVSDSTGAAYGASAGLLARLEATGEPTLRAVVSAAIAVEVDDSETPPKQAVGEAVRLLRDRSRETRELVERACGVTLQTPPLQQVEAMQQMLPGQPLLLSGYSRIVLPDQIAAQGWTSGSEIGSHSGWVWGRTASRRPMPVRLDLTDASRLNCAAGTLWVGDSGGGKTFAAGLALVQSVLSGAYVVNSDPKGDHKWWHCLPEELVQEVRIDQRDERQWGMLDPFLVAAPDRRVDVAMSWLRSLLPRSSNAQMDVALKEAIGEVSDRVAQPTCWHVLDRLGEIAGEDSDADLVLRALQAHAERGLARLAFARPDHTGITLGSRRVTSIVSNSFQRARSGIGRSDWNDLEVVSMGLVELIGHLTSRIASEQRATLKILNSDEAHADLATDLGRGQIDAAQRMGRSELLVASIATQAPSDLTDARLKNLFGQYVLFRALDETEAVAGLQLAGLSQDEETIARLLSLPTGQALMRDYRGRTGWVDCLAPRAYVEAVSEQHEFEATETEAVA